MKSLVFDEFIYNYENYIGNEKGEITRMKELLQEKIPAEVKLLLENYRNLPLYKKRLQRLNKRLIIEGKRIKINDEIHEVFVFRHLYDKESKEYERVSDDPRGWFENNRLKDGDKITLAIRERINEFVKNGEYLNINQKEKPPLPHEYVNLFHSNELMESYELYIYESEEFSKKLSTLLLEKRNIVYNLIKDYIDNKSPENAIDKISNCERILKRMKDDFCISIYLWDLNKENRIIYLSEIKEDELTKNKITNRNVNFDVITENEIAKRSKKNYPGYFFADKEDWELIQSSNFGIIFSEEEKKLFRKEIDYPFILIGGAGSGKSTILYMIFREMFVKKYINGENIDPPIFITYSKYLVEMTRKIMEKLIKEKTKDKLSDFSGYKISSNLSKSVKTLKDILENNSNQEYERKRFDANKHVNYARFKEIYETTCHLKDKNKMDVDLLWYIIRTLIKGYSNEQVTDEVYLKLPNKDKAVPPDIFSRASSLYDHWYKCYLIDNDLWDDLDLLKYVMSKDEENGYSMVICDEAQDFTRLELLFIYKLSSYKKYAIPQDIRAPFVFAGDKLQTIIPTGFSWEKLKKLYSEEFHPNSIEESPELTLNYRSTRSINNISNYINQYRKDLLGDTEFKSLEPWRITEGALPVIFSNNNAEVQPGSLKTGVPILLPVSTDEIDSFIKNDSKLMKMIFDENDLSENNSQRNSNLFASNVFALEQIKGASFEKIILYGFGDYFYKKELYKTSRKENKNEEEEYLLNSFFNKIYVGITRAEDNLFIMDSEGGIRYLWDDIFSNEESKKLIGKMNDEYISEISISDPLTNANIIRSRADKNEDTELFLRAASYYDKAGDVKNKNECYISLYILKKEYEKAGDVCIDNKNYADGFKCFWKAKTWEKLLNYKDLDETKAKVANYFLNESEQSNRKTLENILKLIASTDFHNDETWDFVINNIVKSLYLIVKTIKREDEDFEELLKNLKKICSKGKYFIAQIVGLIYYNNEEYDKAIQEWDNELYEGYIEEDQIKREYYSAKYKTERDINKRISYLSCIDDKEELLKFYLNNRENVEFSDSSSQFILDVLKLNKKYSEYIDLTKKTGKYNVIRDAMEEIYDDLNNREKEDVIKYFIESDFIRNYEGKFDKNNYFNKMMMFIINNTKIFITDKYDLIIYLLKQVDYLRDKSFAKTEELIQNVIQQTYVYSKTNNILWEEMKTTERKRIKALMLERIQYSEKENASKRNIIDFNTNAPELLEIIYLLEKMFNQLLTKNRNADDYTLLEDVIIKTIYDRRDKKEKDEYIYLRVLWNSLYISYKGLAKDTHDAKENIETSSLYEKDLKMKIDDLIEVNKLGNREIEEMEDDQFKEIKFKEDKIYLRLKSNMDIFYDNYISGIRYSENLNRLSNGENTLERDKCSIKKNGGDYSVFIDGNEKIRFKYNYKDPHYL